MGMTAPSLHLVPFFQLCLVLLIVCIGGSLKAVGWVSAVCVVHVDVHGDLSYVVGGYNVVVIEHGRYGPSCLYKLWSARALGLYGMLERKLYSWTLILLYGLSFMWKDVEWGHTKLIWSEVSQM